MKSTFVKHEIVLCERCGTSIECRANSYSKCQCSAVELSVNEVQYISERYDNCLCAACLQALKQEYIETNEL
ncbi:MAG: cysteine-rich CWC family protein [Pseudosphingobacterium sp.]|nr:MULTISPECIES: cysteine-rich CWC family protein [unclassified Olivibacter]MCL4641782.1 cysteine-rich CWC family protein [Olivibacter sp. UJ_SKK_5.1]MDM8174172.1 cysteine-rich CWC family protein [Olivibacter sp. 47]MDX3917300.1 cysteine-rich CWC family protein [Pseudosphingobacterium sp.]